MNDKTALLMDIGGTNCRAKIVHGFDRLFEKSPDVVSRTVKISDKQAFFIFIEQLLGTGNGAVRPDVAVLCFAGPVIAESVSMLNWTGRCEITLTELIQAGLPETDITLLNDMEAAAYGLLACREGHINLDSILLYSGPDMGRARNTNSVLMIPGTGIGVSAVVSPEETQQDISPQVVACELQHTPIPALNDKQEAVLNNMKTRLSIKQPSWEDFVSGRGLENIYTCLGPNRQGGGLPRMRAEEIASRAINERNKDCADALDMFYQCCGALAQVLALTFQPYGGIYLAGESTRKNIGYIPDSPFLGQLQDNEVRAGLLRQFPVYLVNSELNLDGAAYVAGQSRSKN